MKQYFINLIGLFHFYLTNNKSFKTGCRLIKLIDHKNTFIVAIRCFNVLRTKISLDNSVLKI